MNEKRKRSDAMSGYERVFVLCVCISVLLSGCVTLPPSTTTAPGTTTETSVMTRQEQMVIEVNEDLLIAAFNGDAAGLRGALKPEEGEDGADKEGEPVVENGSTALLLASVMGHAGSVRALIDAGVDVNGRSARGCTALMWAAGSRQDTAETVAVLLELGADVNAGTVDGRTALMDAALHGNTPVVRDLLLAGSEVNVRTKRGRTPLFEAVRGGSDETVRLLLSFGAEPNVRDVEGNTPMTEAREAGFGEIVRLLDETGAVDLSE
jgi:hypothetical protein